MPESEGSNVDTPTGEANISTGISKADKDKWYGVGQQMEAAKDQGKSY